MIKLTVEIKDGRFSYSYEVGEDRHNSSSPISADALAAVNQLLSTCIRVRDWRDKEWERELWGKAYMEKVGVPAGSEGKKEND